MSSLAPLTGVTSLYLPLVGTALVIAMGVTALIGKFTDRAWLLLLGFPVLLSLCLIPLDGISLSHWGRIITGDISVLTLVWFTWRVGTSLLPTVAMRARQNPTSNAELCIAAVIVSTALLLYPTALGLTRFDLYALGYYPVLLAPVLFALFAWCLWFGHLLPATLLAVAYSCWALGILESDNLWDYLIDPVVTIYALVLLLRHKARIKIPSIDLVRLRHQTEAAALFTLGSLLGFAVFLSEFQAEGWRPFIAGGLLVWGGVLAMTVAFLVSARRVYVLRQARGSLFLVATSVLAVFCLLVIWRPGFLLPWLVLLLLLATPFYRTHAAVQSYLERVAAPMPSNYHLLGYLLVLVAWLIDAPGSQAIAEFAGSIIFALQVIYPANQALFAPDKPL